MSLPALVKSWVISVNNVVTSSGAVSPYTNDYKSLILNIKNTLKTLLTGSGNEWTVAGSSNSVTAGMDGVDRWATVSNIVNGAGAHSWIVLQQDAIAPNYQLLIDFNNSTVYDLSIRVSPTVGFSGGNTTTAPTASDSAVVNLDTVFNWYSWYDGINPVMYNVWCSSDGQVTRVGCVHKGTILCLMMFEKPLAPISQWTSSSISYINTPTNGWFQRFTGYARFISNISGSTVTHRGVSAGVRGYNMDDACVPHYVSGFNTFINEFEFFPIGLFATTVGYRGRQGNLSDVWIAHWSIPDGATFPGDDTRQFVKWGIFMLPWNGLNTVKMF